MFSLITSEIFQVTFLYRYQLIGEAVKDILSIKEMIQCANLGIPKRMKKNAVSGSIAFCLDVLIRNETITSEE